MNTTSEQPSDKRKDRWLAGIIIAFVLGFLLAWWLLRQQPVAKPVCPQASQAAPAAASRTAQNGGGNHGAPGKGSPTQFDADGRGNNAVGGNGAPASGAGGAPSGGGGSGSGKVSGGGRYDVSGGTTVSGTAGAAADGKPPSDAPAAGGGGNGDLKLPPANGSAVGGPEVKATSGNEQVNGGSGNGIDGGGGAGNTPSGDSQPAPSTATVQPQAGMPRPVTASSGGALQLGPPMDDSDLGTSRPANKVLAALDYRYDKSGLPHYPNAIKVASGTDATAAAAAAGPNSKNFSVTEIVTDDPPDVAAAWYHDHLPAGWNELSMPSADAMNQAIAQTKTPAANGDPVSAMLNALVVGPQLQQSKPGVDAARAAGLTIFQPADPNTDHRMIIVIRDSKTGKTGVLLMKKAGTQ